MAIADSKFTQNYIFPLFVRFALPGVLAMMFIALQTIADGFLVGRLISATALAGVNIAVPAYTFVTAVALVIGVGCQAQLCLNLGKGEFDKAKVVLVSGLTGLAVFAIDGIWLAIPATEALTLIVVAIISFKWKRIHGF